MPLKWLQIIQALPGHPAIAREHLAITFLVGAMRTSLESRTVSPKIAQQELLSLLTSFTDDTPQEYVISIFRCANINKPVVKLLPFDYARYYQYGLNSSIQNRRTVLLDSELVVGQPSLSKLNERLFQEIGSAICSGRFSFRSGDYHAFNSDECDFIEGSTSL
jgi:hypothetical protein